MVQQILQMLPMFQDDYPFHRKDKMACHADLRRMTCKFLRGDLKAHRTGNKTYGWESFLYDRHDNALDVPYINVQVNTYRADKT